MKRSIRLSILALLLLPATLAFAGIGQRLQRLEPGLRREAALQIVKRTFDNRFKSDGALLGAVESASSAKDAAKLRIDKLVEGGSLLQQQRAALNVLVAHPLVSEGLAAAAAAKLKDLGDKSSYAALQNAMYRGGMRLIPAVASAVGAIGKRIGAPEREPLDLRRYASKRDKIEAILERGRIEAVKPLDSNGHLFAAYVVTFAERVDGEKVQALFKPTGEKSGDNWLPFAPHMHLKGGAFSFMAREVFSYEFDKRVEAGRVTPTVGAVIDVPGLGVSMGSLQYWMREGTTFGSSWDRTRARFQAFEASTDGIRQMDVIKLMAWISGSPEHVPCEIRSGNKGNLFVAEKNPFPPAPGAEGGWRLMMIDNAASWTNIVEMHERGDWMLPLRFEQRLKRNLRELRYREFLDWASPFIGKDEAKGAWWRIQRALDVANGRPEWSAAPRLIPVLRLAA